MISFRDLEQHRAALTGHCYRMMGSPADADDAVQETMVRAWRGLAGFEERASLRTWLTRIATRVCLDALADRTRRLRPIELEGPGTVDDPLTEHLQTAADPEQRLVRIRPAAEHRSEPVLAKPGEIGCDALRARDDDEVGTRKLRRPAGIDNVRDLLEEAELIQIGRVGVADDCD